jgi:hypothetical protein
MHRRLSQDRRSLTLRRRSAAMTSQRRGPGRLPGRHLAASAAVPRPALATRAAVSAAAARCRLAGFGVGRRGRRRSSRSAGTGRGEGTGGRGERAVMVRGREGAGGLWRRASWHGRSGEVVQCPLRAAPAKFWTATDAARRLARTAAARRHRRPCPQAQRPAAIDAHTPLPTRCPYHPDNALPRATMRATATCLAPGFVKRSLDEFKRLSLFGERRRAPSPPPRPQD